MRLENHWRALRWSLWVGLLQADVLGLTEIQNAITSVISHVDALRDDAEFLDAIAPTLGPEMAEAVSGARG